MSSPPNANSFRQGKMFKNYLNDKATYPIFIIIGFAGALVAFAGSRTLFKHPDVYIGKDNRQSLVRDNTDAGTRHSTNWLRSLARSKNDNDTVSVFPSLNKALLGKHVNPSVQHDDDDE